MKEEVNLTKAGDNLQTIMNEIDNLEKEFDKSDTISEKSTPLRAIPTKESGGPTTFSMSFRLGEREATINVQDQGLRLQVDGLQFKLSKDGVNLAMKSGAEFSMPWETGKSN